MEPCDHEPSDQKVLDDIRQHGWHVVLIADDEGPPFAFSVGLHHTFGHPEVVVTGIPPEAARGIVSDIGECVRRGQQFQAGDVSEEILEGRPCRFVTVDREFYADHLGYALWFYQGAEFPALQCVWPTPSGWYPWDPNPDPWLGQKQPVLNARYFGRVERPSSEDGWGFDQARDAAAITTDQVLGRREPIRLVHHYADDGSWAFQCGTSTRTEDGRVISMAAVVALDPSVVEVADLAMGWSAVRDAPDQPWQRRLEPEE